MVIRIATAVLVRNHKVLMAHRHHQRQAYPDSWALIGGHVEPGESARQALIRECWEELDVEIQDPSPFAMTVKAPNLRMHAFLVTQWVGEPRNAAPEEHDELRWFRTDELATVVHAYPETVPAIVRAVQLRR